MNREADTEAVYRKWGVKSELFQPLSIKIQSFQTNGLPPV